jgi:hypothetical protein
MVVRVIALTASAPHSTSAPTAFRFGTSGERGGRRKQGSDQSEIERIFHDAIPCGLMKTTTEIMLDETKRRSAAWTS